MRSGRMPKSLAFGGAATWTPDVLQVGLDRQPGVTAMRHVISMASSPDFDRVRLRRAILRQTGTAPADAEHVVRAPETRALQVQSRDSHRPARARCRRRPGATRKSGEVAFAVGLNRSRVRARRAGSLRAGVIAESGSCRVPSRRSPTGCYNSHSPSASFAWPLNFFVLGFRAATRPRRWKTAVTPGEADRRRGGRAGSLGCRRDRTHRIEGLRRYPSCAHAEIRIVEDRRAARQRRSAQGAHIAEPEDRGRTSMV